MADARILRERWLAWARAAGAKGEGVEAVFEDLARRYAEPGRAYHTLDHIGHCLREFESLRSLARDPAAVEMAIWFHDAIYDPRSRDNEDRSAELARETAARLGLPETFGRRVAELILATRHAGPPEDPDAQILADTDLSILGAPEGAFDDYERAVRREYAWVPEPAFRSARAEILRRLLDRPALYSTRPFRHRFEKRARSNLSRSLKRLEG